MRLPWKKNKSTRPDRIMEEGWQFYHRPTTLEPVGTIFRIDSENKRFIVDKLNIRSTRGMESDSRLESSVAINVSVLARILGIGSSVAANANMSERVQFQLVRPEREVSTDTDVDNVLDPYLTSLRYRVDNRYFLIRACCWASAMTYRLSKERILDLGGEATLSEAITVDAKIRTINENLNEIDHNFPEPMLVMFLPDEIKRVSAGLGGEQPELGRAPVNELLVWED